MFLIKGKFIGPEGEHDTIDLDEFTVLRHRGSETTIYGKGGTVGFVGKYRDVGSIEELKIRMDMEGRHVQG